MEIQTLSSEVIDQIAAGEVVERPAHLLKELLENSIDAGSTKIEIQIEQGGEWIKVIDNGKGILDEDLPLVFARHATSKISSADDLWNLHSFGFRGEALASISSVSKTQILSRHKTKKNAFKIESHFGKISSVAPTGSIEGTTILVEELFNNVPARKKFLKSAAAEVSHIKNVVKALALVNPQIEFKLKNKQELISFWAKDKSTLERAEQVLSIKPLYQVKAEYDGFELDFIYTSPADVSKTSKNMWYFVQDRWVQDKTLHAAVMEAFRQLLMHGEYPQCILSLKCPTDFVDVNIHPTKSQIKFSDSQKIFQFVHNAIRAELELAPWLKNIGRSEKQSFVTDMSYAMKEEDNFGSKNFVQSTSPEQVPFRDSEIQTVKYSQRPSFFEFNSPSRQETKTNYPSLTIEDLTRAAEFTPERGKTWSKLQVIGQLNNTYVVCQSNECMVLVDQHAAHERVAFERLMSNWKKGQLESQSLLIPITMQLEESLCEALELKKMDLSKAGLEIERSGPDQISIETIPAFMKESAVTIALDQLAREMAEKSGSHAFETAVADLFATMACHSVVRAGHVLNQEQMQQLLVQMDEFPLSSFCPHGRPVSYELSFNKIEREFGRTQ